MFQADDVDGALERASPYTQELLKKVTHKGSGLGGQLNGVPVAGHRTTYQPFRGNPYIPLPAALKKYACSNQREGQG